MENCDLAIIGAGPGGYVAAIRAAQSGKKVVLFEKGELGGTCLNVGCIPSKTYLRHSELVQGISRANDWGIRTGPVSVDFPKLVERKDGVVKTLQSGIGYLLKKNGITLIQGTASVSNELVVEAGERQFRANDVLLATGSRPFIPPIPGLGQTDYVTTDTFFDLKALPDSLVIIGGGVIAVELAFAMAPLGTAVTILEVADDILLTEDAEARAIIKKRLKKMEVQVVTKAEITKVMDDGVMVGGRTYGADCVLVAAGRTPNLEPVKELGLELDASGRFVQVDEQFQTSRPHVYAVGDLIGGYQLAHAASAEGLMAVRAMCGEPLQSYEQASIPRCVYTTPEIATFGLSEEEAKKKGHEVKVTKSLLSGNGKALAMGEEEGFVKLIADVEYGEILGAVIVGPHATEMIQEVLGIKHSEGTMHELATLVQAHPSVSESIGESANDFFGRAIHQ